MATVTSSASPTLPTVKFMRGGSRVPPELYSLLDGSDPLDLETGCACFAVGRMIRAIRILQRGPQTQTALDAITAIREALAGLVISLPDRAAVESALETLGI